MPISRFGGRVEVSGKQGDLTPVLQLARDEAAVADLAPEIAEPTRVLVADRAPEPARAEDKFFSLVAKRIRQFIARPKR